MRDVIVVYWFKMEKSNGSKLIIEKIRKRKAANRQCLFEQ